MSEDQGREERRLADVTRRLRAARQVLAMTVYTIQHQRRTPLQVRAVLDRAAHALRRSELLHQRHRHAVAVH